MCVEAPEVNPWTLTFASNCFKMSEICPEIERKESYCSKNTLDNLNTQVIYDKAVYNK